jgi:hypothetical protein
MAFRSKSRRIGGVSLTTLFGILLISFCAFFGFRTLFSDLNQNIGVEALAAAFGALFVLLPTKILMDQENDNKVEGEKRTAVFNLSLGSYRKLTQVMFKVLLDEKIEEQELQDLRKEFYDLMILGSDGAIKSALDFIEICTEKFPESDATSKGQNVLNLSEDDYENLLEHALLFVGEARAGLKLSDDDFEWDDERIQRIIDMSRKVTKKQSGARQEISGKLDGWIKLRSYDEYKDVISSLIEAIKNQNPSAQEKYTKSTISFSDIKRGRNVFYIDYISKKNGHKLKCAFPSLLINEQNEKLKTKIEKQIEVLDGVTVNSRKTGDNQNMQLRLDIEMGKLTEDNLLLIGNVVLLFAEGFEKK